MSGDQITELWAWVSLDPADGNEGVLGMIDNLGTIPLIGADRDRIESYREYAQQMAQLTPFPIELRHFSCMRVVERLVNEQS